MCRAESPKSEVEYDLVVLTVILRELLDGIDIQIIVFVTCKSIIAVLDHTVGIVLLNSR